MTFHNTRETTVVYQIKMFLLALSVKKIEFTDFKSYANAMLVKV